MAKTIDFTKLEFQVSFDGTKAIKNIAKDMGNFMRYTGSVMGDIGFDELAKEIYFSKGKVLIPDEYVKPMLKVIMDSNFISAIKHELVAMLTAKEKG